MTGPGRAALAAWADHAAAPAARHAATGLQEIYDSPAGRRDRPPVQQASRDAGVGWSWLALTLGEGDRP